MYYFLFQFFEFVTVSLNLYLAFTTLTTLIVLIVLTPFINRQILYLHRFPSINLKDLAVPEKFGFLPGQVNEFFIEPINEKQERLYAWHLVSKEIYHQHFLENSTASFIPSDKKILQSLQWLKSDQEVHLISYLHGATGCIASDYRAPSYRAAIQVSPKHTHLIAFDYRGFGLSTGTPSQEGLVQDGIAVVEWALKVAHIPPERIVLYGHSLGAAVASIVMEHYAALPSPVFFSGHIFVAPFRDIATWLASYRLGGFFIIQDLVPNIPPLIRFLYSLLVDTWSCERAMTQYLRYRHANETQYPYYIHLIHAKNDPLTSVEHSHHLFWHAVKTVVPITFQQLAERKQIAKVDLKQGGWQVSHTTTQGCIRQTVMNEGGHSKLTTSSFTSVAVRQAFCYKQTPLNNMTSLFFKTTPKPTTQETILVETEKNISALLDNR